MTIVNDLVSTVDTGDVCRVKSILEGPASVSMIETTGMIIEVCVSLQLTDMKILFSCSSRVCSLLLTYLG